MDRCDVLRAGRKQKNKEIKIRKLKCREFRKRNRKYEIEKEMDS